MWFITKYIFVVIALLFSFLVTGQQNESEEVLRDTHQKEEEATRDRRLQLQEQERQMEGNDPKSLNEPVDTIERQEMEETEKRENFYSW